MNIQQLKDAQADAISIEDYETAGAIKTQIEQLEKTSTETLYQDAEGYTRNAPEQFSGTHDTVAKKWEYSGKVTEITTTGEIHDIIFNEFPQEVEKIQLQNRGKDSQFFSLNYGDQELPVSVKKGYVPHTRENIVTLVDAAKEAFGGKVKIATQFRNGHYVSIQPTDEYRRSVFGGEGGDTINPRLIIQAICGGGGYLGSMGWYRDVCNNLTLSLIHISEPTRPY